MEVIKTGQPIDLLLADTVIGPELTEDEKQIVLTLFERSADKVSVYIPDDTPVDTLHSWLTASAHVRAKLEHAQRKIKPIMGRMFLLVKNRKDLLDSFECKSFTQFMDIYVPRHFALSPQDAWSALFVAREFPGISCDEYEAVGISNLKTIVKAVPTPPEEQYNLSPYIINERKRLIEEAKVYHKTTQLASRIEELGIAKRKQVIQDKIYIPCDQQLADTWEAFRAEPHVIQYVGSDDPKAVFSCMMGDCYAAWLSSFNVSAGE